jgi:hypothetical protein
VTVFSSLVESVKPGAEPHVMDGVSVLIDMLADWVLVIVRPFVVVE